MRSHPYAAPAGLITAARDEMLAIGAAHGHDGAGWTLGVDLDGPEPLPAVRRLDRSLRQVVDLVPDGAIFSFAKAAIRAPADATGIHATTFHVDTHPGAAEGLELRRVLVNLAPTPRRVRVGRTTRHDLEAASLVDPDDFYVRDLPARTEVEELTLPAYDGGTAHALDFWPSLVPHVGINDGGYLLVSYERPAPSPLSRTP